MAEFGSSGADFRANTPIPLGTPDGTTSGCDKPKVVIPRTAAQLGPGNADGASLVLISRLTSEQNGRAVVAPSQPDQPAEDALPTTPTAEESPHHNLPEGVEIKRHEPTEPTPGEYHRPHPIFPNSEPFNFVAGRDGDDWGKLGALMVTKNGTDGDENSRPDRYVRLEVLDVASDKIGAGIESALLEEMESHAINLGASRVEGTLSTDALRRALYMPNLLANHGYTVNLIEGRFTKQLDEPQSPGVLIEAEIPVVDERAEYLATQRSRAKVLSSKDYYSQVRISRLEFADIGSAYFRWQNRTNEGILINADNLKYGWGDDFTHLTDVLVEERAVEMWLSKDMPPDDHEGYASAHRQAIDAAVQKAQADGLLDDLLILRSRQLHTFAEQGNQNALNELEMYEHAAERVREHDTIAESESPTIRFRGERSGRTFIKGDMEGAGTHADVFSADEQGQRYAMKLPISPDATDIADFAKEAAYQSSFDHPNITPLELFDTTFDPETGVEVPFIIMPMAESTLGQAIGDSPLPIEEILRVSENTAAAVTVLHENGLIYAGLDLDDILLFRDSQGRSVWKLTDFGGVKPYDEILALGEQYDWAANLIYPTVTGKRINLNKERPSFESMIGEKNMTPLRHALELVVARAMQENPEYRYPSMAALRDDLQAKIRNARHSNGRALPIYRFFTEARERTAHWATREAESVRAAWPIYDSGARSYERMFRIVLSENFRTFLAARRKEKGKVFVLDVMGTGGFLPQYQVDGEVAITLLDHRNDQEKEVDRQRGKLVIAGINHNDLSADVLRNTPWRKAQEYLQTHDNTEMQGFDLATCRPISGWEALAGKGPPSNRFTRLATWIPIQRAYSLLSKNGGTLLVHGPDVGFPQWTDRLAQVDGIDVAANDLELRITKEDGAPLRLPKI